MDIADRLRLDVPVGQAGMGGGLAGPSLAAAVARAGGLGTLGHAPPKQLQLSINQVRMEAPGRAVAVNLLMPYVRPQHVAACVRAKVDVVVLAFGTDTATHPLIRHFREAGVFVFVMVGAEAQARQAVARGADGLIAQGREAGGHLVGTEAALNFLPKALAAGSGRPVFVAGGVATSADTQAALGAGASGVIAGTRFLMTNESGAHRAYLNRIVQARSTIETTLFGLSWPARHRVIPNDATDRWCYPDGAIKALPAAINRYSARLSRVPERGAAAILHVQRLGLPLFTPIAPTKAMPESWVGRTALYAGETARRLTRVTSARQALEDLAP